MILLSILLQAVVAPAAAPPPAEAALATYRERTRADVACRGAEPGDVLVCGRREADRYRVPFESIDGAQIFTVEQRARMLRDPSPCEEKGPFLIGCGAAGVTASSSFGPGADPGVHVGGYRPIAP